MQAIEKWENNKRKGRPERVLRASRLWKYHLAQVTSPGGFHSLAMFEDASQMAPDSPKLILRGNQSGTPEIWKSSQSQEGCLLFFFFFL